MGQLRAAGRQRRRRVCAGRWRIGQAPNAPTQGLKLQCGRVWCTHASRVKTREQDLGDRYGITPTLESWVRVLSEELPGNLELTKDEAWVRTIWGDLPAVLELTDTADKPQH